MKNKSNILIIIAILSSIFYEFNPIGNFSNFIFDIGLVAIVSSLMIFFFYSQSSLLKGYWIRPSLFFLVGYLAVNFQYLLDFRIGFKSVSSTMILHPEILNHCMILGVVGILAFVAGYIYKPITLDNTVSCEYTKRQNLPTTFITILNVLLFGAFLATIDIASFINGTDFGNSERTHSMFEGLFFISIVLTVLSVCIRNTEDCTLRKYIKTFPKISLIVIAAYMGLRLLSGDRGPFIYTAILLFLGYGYTTRKKIRLGIVAIYMIGAMLLISLIGIARIMEKNIGFVDRMDNAFTIFNAGGRFADRGESSISPLTEELGFSFIVNQTDVYAIEEKGISYNYGIFTLTELLQSIPFMPGFMLNTLRIPPEKFSSSGFANYHFFGGYDRTWGVGTSILGDFYLQFGVWGVLIGLFLTGRLFNYLDVSLYIKDKSLIGIYTLLFILLFSSKAIYMPRSTWFVELTNVVWGSIIIFLITRFTSHRS